MLRTRLILSGSKTRLEKTLKKRGATTTAASNPVIGAAVAVAANPSATGLVLLDGAVR